MLHPDPGKLERLLVRRKEGIPWSDSEWREFRVLVNDRIEIARKAQDRQQQEYWRKIREQVLRERCNPPRKDRTAGQILQERLAAW